MATAIGIIGLASFYGPAFAERAHAHRDCSVVAATGSVEDDALGTLGRPTRPAFADTYDCRIVDEVDDVLDSADAVVVATPTSRRAADAQRALSRDVPTLVAKPATGDAAAARALATTAADSAAPLVFTRPTRYDDAIVGVAERVSEGAVGDIVAVRAAIRHDRVPSAGIEANAEHAPGEAGSAYAMAVYTADALLWLADGTPERVTAAYENVNTPHSTHPDLGTATVRFDDGALGTMTMTYSTDCREAWGNWEVEVVGTDGILRTTHQGYEGIHWRSGDPEDRSAIAFARTTSPVLERLFDAFLDTIRGDRPDHTLAPGDAVSAIELCRAWERASEHGETAFSQPTPREE